ncbi:Chemotaxis response regulator protein-glutamate methylesterase CheB [Labilithrix luteola]|uniref:Protein-glutamate methylesterase/protein-glutamine glutaminase n=1 Tax=Labilithrix luteola TaxID=1391654 RepID=A0A0K1PKH9_9BACT|nr:chemotaxis response regulator protein-glutamate methylesterase [Labilithrix luteola]AKU94043.1 Chemotaxis response regulator protein-glutamate methylesterase CheB [Labilithrix luteola]
MKPKLRVLVVDDSALMRQLITTVLSSDPEIEVVGSAPDPIAARAKLGTLNPDVITLDVEMPKMDGLAFLEQLMQTRPTPVVMVSSLTERGCEITLRALELGAVDFVTKPKIDMTRGTIGLASELVTKVKNAGRARVRPVARRPAATRPGGAPLAPSPAIGSKFRTTERIVVIGSSTGGTEALREILTALPPDAPPIVIVQHMPPVFTRQFAQRLDGLCRVRVKEAVGGEALVQGHVLIAPGGDKHLEIVRSGASYGVQLLDAPPVGHHRPSVDILFDSCARAAGPNATGVILTGMGGDGARGMLAMRRAGATTLAEDESTCVVFGMPKEAIACGAVDHVVPLDRMAAALLRAAQDTNGKRLEERR